MHTYESTCHCPQERSAEVLCSGVVAIAQEKCPELLPQAKEVYALGNNNFAVANVAGE